MASACDGERLIDKIRAGDVIGWIGHRSFYADYLDYLPADVVETVEFQLSLYFENQSGGHNSRFYLNIYLYMCSLFSQPLISSCIHGANRETGVSSNVCTNLTVGSRACSFRASSCSICLSSSRKRSDNGNAR